MGWETPSVDFWSLHVHKCTHSHVHKRNHCLKVVRATAERHSRSIQKGMLANSYQEVWGLVRDRTSKGTNEERTVVHLRPAYLPPSALTRKGHDQGQAKEARVGPEQGRSRPVYTTSYGSLVPTPVHSLDHSDMTNGFWHFFPWNSSLAQTKAPGSHSLSIIRVSIKIQT